MGFPLYVACCFSLAAFNILSLCLVFVSLISICLGVFLLGFILYGTLCACWTWLTISFSMLGKFTTIISLKIFSYPFFFSSSSGTPIIWMLVHLIWSQRSLRLCQLFLFFLLYSALQKLFLPFYLPTHWFILLSDILLLIPSREFLISVIVFSLYVYYLVLSFFKLILAFSPFCFQGFWSSLLSLFGSLFQVIFLFPFHLFGLPCF